MLIETSSLQHHDGKDALNKFVFKCRLKDDEDDNCLTVTGMLFLANDPATEKSCSPAFDFVVGTIN